MKLLTLAASLSMMVFSCAGAAFDAAPFALPLPEGNGLQWEDPREVHKVIVHFEGAAPAPESVKLEYWGSRWPQQHLPKDREPGGGDVGWMELGNWYNYGWRMADAECETRGNSLTFTFRPVNAKEFPKVENYPAQFRYTLKLRLRCETGAKISRFEVLTDSEVEKRIAILAWKSKPSRLLVSAFNGTARIRSGSGKNTPIEIECAVNQDPNTFDRTLVTVTNGQNIFTFAVDDLKKGVLFLPQFGVAVMDSGEARDYEAIAAAQNRNGARTLYDRVAEMPEQTWRAAWDGMPAKKSHIYFPSRDKQ